MTLLFVHNVTAVRSRHLFSLVFMISGLMFSVILLDFGTSVLQRETTSAVLRGSMDSLLVLVVFILPVLTIRSFVDDIGIRNAKFKNVVTAAVLIAFYIFADRVLPSTEEVIVHGSTLDKNVVPGGTVAPKALIASEEETADPVGAPDATRMATVTERFLARAAFFGVIFMALLGGYAAVATPRAYLTPFWSRNSQSTARHLVSALSKRHRHVVDLWAAKQRQLVLISAAENTGSTNNNSSGGGGGRVAGFVSWIADTITSTASQKAQLTAEVDGLCRVSLSLFMQISDAEEMLKLAESGRSAKGVAFASFGLVLSLYCVFKMLLTTVNLVLWRFSTTDPVTRLFQLLTIWINLDVDVGFYVSRIALIFNVVVIISAMRGFLVTTFRITTQFMSAVGANTTVLFFSLCMGLYFIAMLLLMRLSLPEQHRLVLSDVIGQLPFYYYHRLNDACFVLSCIVTYVVQRFVLTDPTLE